jgi:CHAT domain-containing protein
MADFYVRLKAGEGKGTALAAAAGQLRSEAKYRHPYYWAPFILIGDWR